MADCNRAPTMVPVTGKKWIQHPEREETLPGSGPRRDCMDHWKHRCSQWSSAQALAKEHLGARPGWTDSQGRSWKVKGAWVGKTRLPGAGNCWGNRDHAKWWRGNQSYIWPENWNRIEYAGTYLRLGGGDNALGKEVSSCICKWQIKEGRLLRKVKTEEASSQSRGDRDHSPPSLKESWEGWTPWGMVIKKV